MTTTPRVSLYGASVTHEADVETALALIAEERAATVAAATARAARDDAVRAVLASAPDGVVYADLARQLGLGPSTFLHLTSQVRAARRARQSSE